MNENECLELAGRISKQIELLENYLDKFQVSDAKRENTLETIGLLKSSKKALLSMFKIHYTSVLNLGECKEQLQKQQQLLDKLLKMK